MTTPNPVSSKGPTRKRPLNEFLFSIVNNFNLDEFKKFTNFPDLMQAAMDRTMAKTANEPQRFTLHDRIRHNFKKVPDQQMWQRGLFNDLKLTTEFYGSDVAKRIFKNIYGLKKCQVHMKLPTESGHSADLEERLQLSPKIEEIVEVISVPLPIVLGTSDESSIDNSIPKRRMKYPRKQTQTDRAASISGIHSYTSTAEFVEQTARHREGFNDEIIISPTEPVAPSSKRVSIISDIVLVPPTPFRDVTHQRQPVSDSHSVRNKAPKRNIGPKSRIHQRGVVYDEETEVLSVTGTTDVVNERLENLPKPKPKIGPKSRLSQRNNSSVEVNPTLPQVLTDTSPPSILLSVESPTLPDRLQDPPPKISTTSVTPRIDPKSVMLNRRQLSLKELWDKPADTGASIEPSVKKSTNDVFATPKPKIGPKSRKSQSKSSPIDLNTITTQELLQDLLYVDPSPIVHEPQTKPSQGITIDLPKHLPKESSPRMSTPPIKPRIGPRSVMLSQQKLQSRPKGLLNLDTSSTAVQSHDTHVPDEMQGVFGPISPANLSASSQFDRLAKNTPLKCFSNKTPLPQTHVNPKSTENSDIGEIPSQVQQTHAPDQLHIGSQGEIYKTHQTHRNAPSVECICIAGCDTSTQCSDSLELRENFKRSIERASQHLTKYVAETERSVQSIKHFWYDFLKSEFEDDSSAAETQLFGTPDDVQLEAQSQAIVHPDQLNVENAEEMQIQMEVLSSLVDQVEVQNENKRRMELESSQDDQVLNVELQSSPVDQEEAQNENKGRMEQESSQDDQVSNAEAQSSPVDPQPVHSNFQPGIKIKVEKVDYDLNETYSSDVQIIELPPDEPIEILHIETQQLFDKLQVDRSDSEELCGPIVIPSPASKKLPTAAGSSKGFLTSLPVIPSKKRNYQPLDIVVEPVLKGSAVEFHAFSQQHLTPPSNENYQIEDCTMTESQHQRYALLNDENTMFLSSQLENYALNTGKTPDPKSAVMPTVRIAQSPQDKMSTRTPLALKRLSQDALNHRSPNKRKRSDDIVRRELNWKIMDIRSITFKPLGNYTFHLEMQLRNNYDTFHIQDQPSIKRILRLSNSEWKHVAKVLTTLNGYRYDSSAAVAATRASDLPSRVINCFVQSIPIFVRSNIQFQDFMGHCLEVSEQQPLRNVNVDAAIDPNVLRKMGELKKQLEKTN